MSVDVHSSSLRASPHDLQVAADEPFDRDATWAEMAITVFVTIFTIAFVSFVAAVMAMA